MTLAEHLKRVGKSPEAFAPEINTTGQSVRRWLAGQSVPRRDTMRLIFEVTGGNVTADDFFGLSKKSVAGRAEARVPA
jgi:hypothetical protein